MLTNKSLDKTTALEISILTLGNLTLLIFLFYIFVNLTGTHRLCSDLNCFLPTTQYVIAQYAIAGSPLFIIPWFILSLINLIRHRKNRTARAITLFASPVLALLLAILSVVFDIEITLAIILMSCSIAITDIIFSFIYIQNQKLSQ